MGGRHPDAPGDPTGFWSLRPPTIGRQGRGAGALAAGRRSEQGDELGDGDADVDDNDLAQQAARNVASTVHGARARWSCDRRDARSVDGNRASGSAQTRACAARE